MKALEIASQYNGHLVSALELLQEQYSDVLTITALAMATFGLFIDVDIRRVVSPEDIIESAKLVLIPPELMDEVS